MVSMSLEVGKWEAYRIFTVSNGWVAVTAPQAAMPPATKALFPLAFTCSSTALEHTLELSPCFAIPFCPQKGS